MPEEENVFQLLNRREQELTHQISALRGQIEAKENELAYVKKAKAATAISVSVGNREIPPLTQSILPHATAIPDLVRRFDNLTIKQLVVQALLDHYMGGATSADLREFIHNAYARSVEASSLRPQLHRLKAQGILDYFPGTETWNLRVEKRDHYTHALLSGALGVKAELASDENPEPEEPDQIGTRPRVFPRRKVK
jgi:hypothetical protein